MLNVRFENVFKWQRNSQRRDLNLFSYEKSHLENRGGILHLHEIASCPLHH